MSDDGWHLWGPVYDRKALIGVITALQKNGVHVHCVRDEGRDRTMVYTDQPPPKVGA